jgi:DNA processing protein
MDNRLYWVWLSLACTPGSNVFKKLIDEFSVPENIYAQCERGLSKVISRRNSDFSRLMDKRLERAEEILNFCTSKGVGIVTYGDEIYPDALKQIDNPPVLLYYRGVFPNFKMITPIAIVGTRSLSDYGRKNAFIVARDLAKSGATIVSGMAMGIDGVALAGALSADMPAVAVIGSGIDVCYPSQHINLARQIVKYGCVITEYPPHTPPIGSNFPVRNRLISALSIATLVIEGKERSGAMITARHAKEQGKPVFAFPGSVGNKNSEASNLLIKNGANLFTSADDVIAILEKSYMGKLNPFKLDTESVDIMKYLSEYKVSCVVPNESVFSVPRRAKSTGTVSANPSAVKKETKEIDDAELLKRGIDKRLLSLYKMIPLNESIDMNSLIGESFTLKEVMQGILKLEMMRFVTVLPGDRVKRTHN